MRWLGIVMFVVWGCSAAIEHGLDETSANEVVSVLERAGIAASKTRDEGNGEGFVVAVAKGDVVRSIEVLRSLGLPRGRRAGLAELYPQGSLLPTPTEERAKYGLALAGEIAKTLEAVDGVAAAHIHLVLPEPDPLAVDGKPRVAAQAAVLVKARAGRAPPISELEVRKLVAGGVPGLEPAAVAVVFTAAGDVPSQTADLVTLGPLRMAPGSRAVALVVAAAGGALLVLLAVLVLLLARRLINGNPERVSKPSRASSPPG